MKRKKSLSTWIAQPGCRWQRRAYSNHTIVSRTCPSEKCAIVFWRPKQKGGFKKESDQPDPSVQADLMSGGLPVKAALVSFYRKGPEQPHLLWFRLAGIDVRFGGKRIL